MGTPPHFRELVEEEEVICVQDPRRTRSGVQEDSALRGWVIGSRNDSRQVLIQDRLFLTFLQCILKQNMMDTWVDY